MRIKYVTVTGADDTTDIQIMESIQKLYPFVEWGVLLSKNAAGNPRFPTLSWLQQLHLHMVTNRSRLKLSGHLCGELLRRMLLGDQAFHGYFNQVAHPSIADYCPSVLNVFKRLQLNFHAEKHEVDMDKFVALLKNLGTFEYIFQLDGVNDELFYKAREAGVKCSCLFDHSHGAGVSPNRWPNPTAGVFCGYAGGLDPIRITDQVTHIQNDIEESGLDTKDHQIWIDMETKVRTNERFDLKKVIHCLNSMDLWSSRGWGLLG